MKRIGTVIPAPDGQNGPVRPWNSEAAAWLASQAPEAVDKAAVEVARSSGVRLVARYGGRYPKGPNGEVLTARHVIEGYEIDGTDADRKAALERIENMLTPPSVEQTEDWMAEVSVLTVDRKRNDLEARLTLKAYTARLMDYPADVVRYALLDRPWEWFPKWYDLRQVCEAMVEPRRRMIAALKSPAPTPKPPSRHATREEKDRGAALVAERYSKRSLEMRERAVREAFKGKCMLVDPQHPDQPEAAE